MIWKNENGEDDWYGEKGRSKKKMGKDFGKEEEYRKGRSKHAQCWDCFNSLSI
jgi:hypothetical protein